MQNSNRHLMLSRISVNLSVPSSTEGISGSRCSHPISSADPRTVLRTRSIRLKVKSSIISIDILDDTSIKKLMQNATLETKTLENAVSFLSEAISTFPISHSSNHQSRSCASLIGRMLTFSSGEH